MFYVETACDDSGVTKRSLAERFWSKVEVTPTCWLWTASRNPSGYGILGVMSEPGHHTTVGAHRVAYELLVGPIPEDCEIDHLCRLRHCVNPAHLEAVSRQENMRRGSRATQTHCKWGHPLEGDNLYVLSSSGKRLTVHRHCRTCMRLAHRRRSIVPYLEVTTGGP